MIRLAQNNDFDQIIEIYQKAREFMRAQGNPTQWGENRPSIESVQKDLQQNQLYVIEEQGEIYGVFALIIGKEPTYERIEGSWMSDKEYATIHRIASSGTRGGVFDACIAFAKQKISHLRIDTHQDNHMMIQKILTSGFVYCGIIYVEDGTKRNAYEWCLTQSN